nr:class I SAM-dependent methyltransferase [uncultured Agathobaculum sp.]
MESMVLTPRLACIASLVPQGARLADIGTDHGKLPVSLLLAGRIAAAIGSDIGEGPLAHAARNAAEHGVSLSLRLAAGLDAVGPEECDTVSIAGMGGQTIAEILAAAPWCERGQHLLLLQPMTMVYELRQWLWAHGYAIARETLCREDRRQYVVLSVRGGAEKAELPLWRCVVSPALLQADGAKDYLRALFVKEKRALDGMERASAIDKARVGAQRRLVSEIQQALEGLQ